MSEEDQGGRVFFSAPKRSMEHEDEIKLLSVGVDIGSATSHLAFSRLLMERRDNRYVVAKREILHESAILLTPYTPDGLIDTELLGKFIEAQYEAAGQTPDAVDTGALILTGVAVRRRNARAIGELFAAQAGKMVAVSAGDALETTLSCYGSGTVTRSANAGGPVMNVDIGGGTSKVSVAEGGKVVAITAIDVGARIVCFDPDGRIIRIEEAGQRFADELGIDLKLGGNLSEADIAKLTDRMAERLLTAMGERAMDPVTQGLLRHDPLPALARPISLSFSGGVSEYIYGGEAQNYGDLGRQLAEAIRRRAAAWGVPVAQSAERIRATVIGASQYTVQVSGSTIFVNPIDSLPVRNIAVIVPNLVLDTDVIDSDAMASEIRTTLARIDLADADRPVALGYRWQGSATYARLEQFSRGVIAGFGQQISNGLPIVLVGEGDIGGLIGLHLFENGELAVPIISIDGILLNELDFVDIGAFLETSGAVPVVIKSLVFPTAAPPQQLRE